MAADIFAQLKWANTNVELVTEYAKDLVWEGRLDTLQNQVYVFGKQLHRIHRLIGKVDVVITDSPLLLSSIYKSENLSQNFDAVVLEVFNEFNNVNYFIERRKPYNPKGRLQTEEGAKEKDEEIKDFLRHNNIPFEVIVGDTGGACIACAKVRYLLGKQ